MSTGIVTVYSRFYHRQDLWHQALMDEEQATLVWCEADKLNAINYIL